MSKTTLFERMTDKIFSGDTGPVPQGGGSRIDPGDSDIIFYALLLVAICVYTRPFYDFLGEPQ